MARANLRAALSGISPRTVGRGAAAGWEAVSLSRRRRSLFREDYKTARRSPAGVQRVAARLRGTRARA